MGARKQAEPRGRAELAPLRIDRPEREYRRSDGGGRSLRGVGWILLLALLGGAGWLFHAPLVELADRVRLPQVKTVLVERGTAAAAQAVQGTAANGHVVAARRAALSADTPGRVVELRVEEGVFVKQGQIVARLYSEEYAAALERAKHELAAVTGAARQAGSEVGAAKAELERLERAATAAAARHKAALASLELARRNLERTRKLVAEGTSTQRDLDAAVEARDVARARADAEKAELESARSSIAGGRARVTVASDAVAVAQARMAAASAARDQAAATLDKTIVRAPFDGVVVLKDAEVGEVVSPSSTGGSNARGSICTMVDLASLEVQVDVPETSLGAVRRGAPASIFLDAYPGIRYTGRVSRIWPVANRQKATIEVRVTFDKPDRRLRPELGARVVFGTDRPPSLPRKKAPETVLFVPEAALLRSDGADALFVIERGAARLRRVEVAGRSSGRAALVAGVAEGDRVIVDPPPRLADGDRVRIAR